MIRICFAAIASVFAWTHVNVVPACTICVGMPVKSDAEYLVESHCVILAREDKDRPFSFAPVEVLKGEFAGPEIDLLVDSLTRRRLDADDERKVLLIQLEKGSPWRTLGIISSNYESVVRRVLLVGPSWNDDSGRAKRVEFFVPLFGHDDPQIYQLAYLEMGKAPYDMIQRLGQVVPRSQYAAMLEDPKYIKWRPLAILLLAQSGHAEDAKTIRESLETAGRAHLTSNLAAWATAAIEMDGAQAVRYLDEQYCRQPDRNLNEVREVARALELHALEGRTELLDEIMAALRAMHEKHPDLKKEVASMLAAGQRINMAERQSTFEATLDPDDNN